MDAGWAGWRERNHGNAPRTDPNFIDSDTDSSRALAHTNTIAACLQNLEVYKGFGVQKHVACLNSHRDAPSLCKLNPLRISFRLIFVVLENSLPDASYRQLYLGIGA